MVKSPKPLKLRAFIEARVKNKESLSPSDVLRDWAALGKKSSLQNVSQVMKRMGLNGEQRQQVVVERARIEAGRDISEYPEVKAYVNDAELHHITKFVINRTTKYIRKMWNMMGKTDPHGWTQESLIEALKVKYPMTTDKQGRQVFSSPTGVGVHLSSVSTIFKGIMREGWSTGLARDKGELVDFFDFKEFEAYDSAAEDYDGMNRLGWQVADRLQVNLGCREGTTGLTGLMSLTWDDINYETRRCSLHEKGGHGKAGRMWKNLPLDLFLWVHGWDALVEWHKAQFGYYPTNAQHGSGRVFPIQYDDYRKNFHMQRKRAGGRMATEKETFTPHIFRKTHAQWLKRMRVPMEIACGKFPDGTFGVGWDNCNIYRDFYTMIEPDEYQEATDKMTARMKALGLEA